MVTRIQVIVGIFCFVSQSLYKHIKWLKPERCEEVKWPIKQTPPIYNFTYPDDFFLCALFFSTIEINRVSMPENSGFWDCEMRDIMPRGASKGRGLRMTWPTIVGFSDQGDN